MVFRFYTMRRRVSLQLFGYPAGKPVPVIFAANARVLDASLSD
jgi:hypothetical protein